MKFTSLVLAGAYLIAIEPIEDERGFFSRSWCAHELEQQGLKTGIAQSNISYNYKKGTLRGLHYQLPPHQENKIIRCTAGSIFDVLVDLRPESPTYTQWVGLELSARNHHMLYVPEGFAHGFQTLEDGTEITYLVSEFYAPNAERGVRWNDPCFAIQWPDVAVRIISSKDQSYPDFTP